MNKKIKTIGIVLLLIGVLSLCGCTEQQQKAGTEYHWIYHWVKNDAGSFSMRNYAEVTHQVVFLINGDKWTIEYNNKTKGVALDYILLQSYYAPSNPLPTQGDYKNYYVQVDQGKITTDFAKYTYCSDNGFPSGHYRLEVTMSKEDANLYVDVDIYEWREGLCRREY